MNRQGALTILRRDTIDRMGERGLVGRFAGDGSQKVIGSSPLPSTPKAFRDNELRKES
jgi:hypothetical protein